MTTCQLIKNRKCTMSADGGFDEVLTQKDPIIADCWMDGNRVVKVVAPDGVVFAGPSGELRRPDNFDITDLCDLEQVARDIEYDRTALAEVRAERHQWHREFCVAAA